MKTIGLIGVMGLMLCGCDSKERAAAEGRALDARRSLVKVENELRRSELEKQRLEGVILELEGELATARHRVELANDSAALYRRLLDDSNAEKMRQAEALMREALGR